LERLGDEQVRVVLHEGRFHQVKRMLGALGGHVTALHRERIGDLELDPALAPGDARELNASEWASLARTLPKERLPSAWQPPEGYQPRDRRRRARRGESATKACQAAKTPER
jgi:hypothetical protein